MMKRYTAAEIEMARDYIGSHADALPRVEDAPTTAQRNADDTARMQASTDRQFEAMLARQAKKDAARARRAARLAAKAVR